MDLNQADTVVVTGGGRGIGAAIARSLARRGYHIAINYRSDAGSATQVRDDIVRNGGSAVILQADVTSVVETEKLMRAVVADGRTLAGVVINANTAPPPFESLADLEWEAFADKITTELAGAFHITRQAVSLMRAQGSGKLVYLGSTAADYVGGGRLAHGTAKAALATFARHIAAETAREGISVFTVAPGAVATEASAGRIDETRRSALADNSSLGRMLEPDDIAAAIALCFDPALRPATGTTLRLDAGWSLLVGGPTA